MDLSRFLELPATHDGRRVVTLLADPSMTDAAGQPAGFLSLVDKGANLRRFQVVKGEDLEAGQLETYGKDPEARSLWGRLLTALGLGSSTSSKSEPAPALTFEAAVAAERLSRARWEATDALWDVIRNVLGSDLEDKRAAIELALGQFSTMILGLVTSTAAMKAEDAHTVLAGLEPPSEVVSKAGRMISARNMGTLTTTRDAMAEALAKLEALIDAATPSQASKAAAPSLPSEDPAMLTPAQLSAHAEAAAASAVKAAKSAGLTDPAALAAIAVDASTTVHKAAVQGYPAPALPSDTLANQMGQAKGGKGGGKDPHAMLQAVLGQVSSLSTKLDGVVSKVDAMDAAINGAGDGEDREPGLVEISTKAAELANATAVKVSKLESTPSAPRGGSDPERPVVTKAEDSDAFAGSPLSFTT